VSENQERLLTCPTWISVAGGEGFFAAMLLFSRQDRHAKSWLCLASTAETLATAMAKDWTCIAEI